MGTISAECTSDATDHSFSSEQELKKDHSALSHDCSKDKLAIKTKKTSIGLNDV